MLPQFEVFGRLVGSYWLMMVVAIVAFSIYGGITALKRKYDFIDMGMFYCVLSIGVLLGSHLLYTLINYKNIVYVVENINEMDIFHAFGTIFNGRIFYGGLLGTLIAAYIVVKNDISYAKYIDITAAGIPLFHFFARIGCFLAGCCYGVQSKIGFTYHNSTVTDANDVMRFPVQLLESLFCLILFLYLNYLLINNKFKNNLIFVYLFLYSIGRFFIEFLRGDQARGILFFLSTSQIISLILLTLVLTKFYLLRKKQELAESLPDPTGKKPIFPLP